MREAGGDGKGKGRGGEEGGRGREGEGNGRCDGMSLTPRNNRTWLHIRQHLAQALHRREHLLRYLPFQSNFHHALLPNLARILQRL